MKIVWSVAYGDFNPSRLTFWECFDLVGLLSSFSRLETCHLRGFRTPFGGKSPISHPNGFDQLESHGHVGDKPSSPPGGHGHHDSHNHHHQGHHDHYNHHNHGFGFGGASSIISRTSFVSYTAELLILIDISGSAMCCQQTVLLLEWGERSLVFDVCFFERIVQNTAELFPAQSMSTSMIGPHDHSFCEFHFQDHQLDVSELDVSEMRYTPTMWWGKWWWTNGFRGANFWTNPNGITPSILIQSKVWTFPIWALVEAVRVVSWHPCRTQLDAPSAWLGNT